MKLPQLWVFDWYSRKDYERYLSTYACQKAVNYGWVIVQMSFITSLRSKSWRCQTFEKDIFVDNITHDTAPKYGLVVCKDIVCKILQRFVIEEARKQEAIML